MNVKLNGTDLLSQDQYVSQNDYLTLLDARKHAQEAANKYQRIVDCQIDDLRILQQTDWKDVNAMSRVDYSISQLERARSDYDRLMNKYFEAGGMESIYVRSRHSM